MPATELTESLKAKLYDRASTPFFSSFILSWIVLNHEYIYIYVSKIEPETKIKMLHDYGFGTNGEHLWLYPLLIGLTYVFIYPIFFNLFYSVTLLYRKLTMSIRTRIEDITPMPMKEAREIRTENSRLTMELEERIEEIAKIENKYNSKKNKEIEKLNETISEKVIEITKLTNDVKGNTESIRMINEERKRLGEVIQKQDEKIKNMEEIHKNDLEELNHELGDAKNAIDNYKKESEKLHEKIQEMKEENVELIEEKDVWKERTKKLIGDIKINDEIDNSYLKNM